ncbi:MAG: hypothetical protein ACRDVC_08710 [Acidimicrobiales bacterium]
MSAEQRDQASFAREWSDWRREREKRLSDPHGFLAITGLHWLDSESTRFDDVLGAWSTGDDGVRVVLADGVLSVNGVAVHGVYGFGIVEEGPSLTANFADAVVEVAKRGGS